jgi:hypothetical protein
VCPDSGVTWPYLPHPIANTPVGHWWAMAATAGRPGAWGPPDPGSDPDPKPPAPWPFLLVQQATSCCFLGCLGPWAWGAGAQGPPAAYRAQEPRSQLGAWGLGLGLGGALLQAPSDKRDAGRLARPGDRLRLRPRRRQRQRQPAGPPARQRARAVHRESRGRLSDRQRQRLGLSDLQLQRVAVA